MDLNELLRHLDLESPDEFEYFEHLADLLELEEPFSSEACFTLFSAVSSHVLTELIANYFEDIMENMPDDTVDIYALLTAIRQNLLGLALQIGEPDGRRLFSDELVKFHDWYALDSSVRCKGLSDGAVLFATVCEALALCRLERLNGEEYDYDFSPCLDYDIEEYSMRLGDLMEEMTDGLPEDIWEDEDAGAEDSCGHLHGLHHGTDAFSEGLIDRDNPVIDGECYDEED